MAHVKGILFFLLATALNILHAQNVGVGTTTPDEKLDIEGNITLGENPNHKISLGFNANGWSYQHPYLKLPGKYNGGTYFMHYFHIHRAIDTLDDRIYYLDGWKNDPTINIWGSVDSSFNVNHPYHRLVLHSTGIQASNLYINKGRTLRLNPLGGHIIMGNDTLDETYQNYNLGIGNETPRERLDVSGNIRFGDTRSNYTHQSILGIASDFTYNHSYLKLPGKITSGTNYMHGFHIQREIDNLDNGRRFFVEGWEDDPLLHIWESNTDGDPYPDDRLSLSAHGIQATNRFDKKRPLFINPNGGDIIIGNDSVSGNVGIGLLYTASEKLEIKGNFRIDSGAIMPSGNAGLNGQILTSNGPNSTPEWSTSVMNASATTGFGKYFIVIDTIYSNSHNAFTVNDPNCVTSSSLSASFTGMLPIATASERAGLTINNIEARNGEYIISISNYNPTNYINFQMAVIAFY